MTVKLQRIRRVDLSGNELPKESEPMVVWWYGPIVCDRSRAPTIPKVRVFFRKILDNGDLGPLFSVDVGITHLGLLRIGSVWRDGIRESQIEYEQKTVTVSLDDGSFRIISPFAAKKEENRDLIPNGGYEIHYKSDRNFLLDLRVQDGNRLLIPCLEFFTRMYGKSAELRRVLAAYPWSEAEKQLYKPIKDEALVQPNCWPIRLAKKMYNDDAVFLSHVRHDPYAQEASKQIYAQIEAACTGGHFTFLKVKPWHRGELSLIVEGKYLPDGSFLGLRIQGYSDPVGITIARDRENSALVDPDSQGVEHEGSGQSKRIAISRALPDILNLTEEDEPDQTGRSVEILEDEILRIGERRAVLAIKRAQAQGEAVGVRHPTESGTYSTGERHGTGKGVGSASIHADIALESRGQLRDIWDAAIWLQRECPADIQTVDWFTLANGFQTSDDPKLIPLVPLKRKAHETEQPTEESEKKRAMGEYTWAFFDVAEKIPRGILVIRLLVRGMSIYLIEIQQRHEKDKYSGLVFSLEKEDDLRSWITTLMVEIPKVEGVMGKVIAHCPGKARTFRHDQSDETPIMKWAVVNGLEKVCVTLKIPRKKKPTRGIDGA